MLLSIIFSHYSKLIVINFKILKTVYWLSQTKIRHSPKYNHIGTYLIIHTSTITIHNYYLSMFLLTKIFILHVIFLCENFHCITKRQNYVTRNYNFKF